MTETRVPDLALDLPTVDAVRADGGLVQLRLTRPDDLEALRALHAAASEHTLYLRFFTPSRAAAQDFACTLAGPNGPQHAAVVALIRGAIVAVASFERVGPDSAEFCLLVADEWQHEGIGTLLMEHLASVARHVGVHRFVGDVLSENSLMLAVVRDLGFRRTLVQERGSVRVELDLDPDPDLIRAYVSRDRKAEAASMKHVLAPASIAVIGASDRADTVGHQVLRNLLDGGFTGRLVVVNPKRDSVLGVPSVPSARDLPEAVDLAVVAVPAAAVTTVVRDCGVRGVAAILLLTAGFDESGDDAAPAQRDVLAVVREYGMRMVGPNCLGVLNTDPAVRMNATFAAMPMQPGRIALMSQSGAVGVAFADAAARAGAGLSQFVSVGNKADVSGSDLVLSWADDEQTRVIAMYLESVREPHRFLPIAREVSTSKPVLALKAGRTEAGARAGRSHTAAAASSDVAVDALFHACGVMRVDTMPQLLDTARVLADQPVPAGPRVVVLGNSGGPGIMAADAASAAGLQVVQLDVEVTAAVRAAAPSAASVQNPIDLGAAARADEVAAALRAVLASGAADAVLTVFTKVSVTDYGTIRAAIADVARTAEVTMISVEEGAGDGSVTLAGTERRLPVFGFPEPAIAALAAAYGYAVVRERLRDVAERPDGLDRVGSSAVIDRVLDSGAEWLDLTSADELLRSYGIPTCPQRVVPTADDAVLAAREFGYPVVMKITTAGVHKSDVGGVRIALADDAEVRAAYSALVAIDPLNPNVLVQSMRRGGVEAIVGAVRDDLFGPLVMLGSGGVLADVLGDRQFRLAPLSGGGVDELLSGLRLRTLLAGVRGAAPSSVAALRDLVVRLSLLVHDHPEIAEIDLNPVLCGPDDAVAVDARVRVTPRPHGTGEWVRALGAR